MEEKKRRHHYVWRYYLESWSNAGKMYCRKDGKIYSNNPRNLAVENDFYKLCDLNYSETEFLLAFAKSLPAHAERVIDNFIKYFTLHTKLLETYGATLEKNQELSIMLDVHRSNFEENYHEGIEKSALPILKEIINGDVSFYQDSAKCRKFMYFIATQLLRTRKMAAGMNNMPPNDLGIDFKKVWPVQRHMIACNFGCNLFLERHEKPIAMIHNESSVGFIASDNPVINLYPNEARANVCALYYPVSPKRAIVFGDLKDDIVRPIWSVTAGQAHQLNGALAASSHEMIFADSEDVLLNL
jgi:hypothetical protein